MSDAERVESAVAGAKLTAAGFYRVECPFCDDMGARDKKRSLAVHAESGFYRCWKCGERGKIDGLEDGPLFARKTKPVEGPKAFEPPESFELLADGPSLRARAALTYLSARRVTAAAIRELRIGACTEGKWRGRVIVPHFDADDGRTWRGWVGRVWTPKPRPRQLPYLYPAGMARTLYNARVLHVETDEPALAFEGALDVAHYPERAFAFFGGPTDSHLREIVMRARRPVAVVLDGDAWMKGWAFAQKLRLAGVRAGSVRLGPRVDPDEVPRKWLLEEARKCLG